MIEFKAKIKVLDETKVTFTRGENVLKNNISSVRPPLNEVKNCKNPFILGVSKFGDGSGLFSSVDYYIHKYLSSETPTTLTTGHNHYEIPYSPTFYISSNEKIQSLTFVFDTYNEVFPCEVYLKNTTNVLNYDKIINSSRVTIYNPDYYTLNNGVYLYYIGFRYLNKPKRPLVITGIYTGETIEINKRNIISISRNSFDRDDLKSANFGIISNAGDIEFNDRNNKVLEYANNSLLKDGLICDLEINESISNTTIASGEFYTAEWQYDNENKIVNLSLKDHLEEWQDINIEGFSYDAKNRPEYNLKWFYEYLHERTPSKYKMLTFEELDSKTQEILTNIMIKYPMLNSGSLWEQWTKICQVAQAHIYKLDNGKTIFVYKGGN